MYLPNNFRRTDCPFCEFDRRNVQLIAFCKSRNVILQENASVDFSIVLLKIILAPYVHMSYIQHHPQPSLFCEIANLVQFCFLTISKFSYHY